MNALLHDRAERAGPGEGYDRQPTVRGASTSQNADDVLRFDPVDRPVTRGRMARNARR
ncbi:hypothetical protein [Pseudonocardia sp. NPDC049154]|uniref:hypothetical protein n=1 Tax=Pseudonocardia sp. NPDC049154 TaxID=3155501 RepID=UPI0033EEEF3D